MIFQGAIIKTFIKEGKNRKIYYVINTLPTNSKYNFEWI